MIKQLTTQHAQQFCELIVDMYAHLENLEWFSPMPFDLENVTNMIQNPRFFIVGYFEGDTLCAVSSLDYKCGKLIGKIDLPQNCDITKLVEVGFTMVHSAHRGKGIMKQMVAYLLNKIKQDGFKWCFGKVHKNNFASSKSLLKNGFEVFSDYSKPVNIEDFKSLANQPFFSNQGKENAKLTLAKTNPDDTQIIVDYNIIIKKL